MFKPKEQGNVLQRGTEIILLKPLNKQRWKVWRDRDFKPGERLSIEFSENDPQIVAGYEQSKGPVYAAVKISSGVGVYVHRHEFKIKQ